MARLRRWNIINKSEDCEPDDGAGGAGEAGKGGGVPKGSETKTLLFKALKVRPSLVPWLLAPGSIYVWCH